MSKAVKTKIPIAQLSVGMLVTGVDRPWWATPFLSHRIAITTDSEIATLKACGVKLVEVEVAEESAPSETSALPMPKSGSTEQRSSHPPHVDQDGIAPRGDSPHALESWSEDVQPHGIRNEIRAAHASSGAVAVPEDDRRSSLASSQYTQIAQTQGDSSTHVGGRPHDVSTAARSHQDSRVESGGQGSAATYHVETGASASTLASPETSYEDELAVARHHYHQVRALVQRALADAKMGRAFALDAVSRAVGDLADSVIRNPFALSSLSRLKSVDQYTYVHSVNTCVLALTLGRQLNMGREALIHLGLGVLLHDVGKTQVPSELLTKTGPLTDVETDRIKQHVLRGVEYLEQVVKVEPAVLLPVLEHHERMNGSGYPHGRTRAELSEAGLIAGVVDVYDALTSDRPYRNAVSPHQALKTLYEMSRRNELDNACVERFIRCMGIYPVGSCVRLSSGEVGVVSKINPAQTLNPVVMVVRESPAGALVLPRSFDLSQQVGKSVARIAEVLQPSALGISTNEVLDAVYSPSGTKPNRLAA
ncbi:MAG: HD-GYP domain-containing protein [Nitrospiraceae bacterium]